MTSPGNGPSWQAELLLAFLVRKGSLEHTHLPHSPGLLRMSCEAACGFGLSCVPLLVTGSCMASADGCVQLPEDLHQDLKWLPIQEH